MTKSRLYIYIIAGGYVAYTGIGLAKSALAQRPDNYLLYLIIGILFVATGGFFAVKSGIRIFRGDYADRAGDPGDDPQEDEKDDMRDDPEDR